MSRIVPVVYQTISDKLPVEKAAQYFFLNNLLGVDPSIDEEFIDHEVETTKLRNSIIAAMIHSDQCPKNPQLDSSMIGISSLKKETIVMMEC